MKKQVKLIVEMNDYGTHITVMGEWERFVCKTKHKELRQVLQTAYSLMGENDLIEYRDSRGPSKLVSESWFRNKFKLFRLINNNSLTKRQRRVS